MWYLASRNRSRVQWIECSKRIWRTAWSVMNAAVGSMESFLLSMNARRLELVRCSSLSVEMARNTKPSCIARAGATWCGSVLWMATLCAVFRSCSMWRGVLAGLSAWFLWTAQSSNAAIITLAWDSASTNAVRIYQAVGTNPFAIVATVMSATSVNLSVDTNTFIRWFATEFNGSQESGPSNTVTNMPAMPPPPPVNLPPGAPTNLRAQYISGNRVDLAFQSDPRYATKIEQARTDLAFAVIGTVSPGTMHFTTQVRKNQASVFRVRSCESLNCSEPSNLCYVSSR